MSTRKAVAIGLVVLLHALLGYAFITGLAMNVVKNISKDLTVIDVAEEPPPPEELPPPPPPETPTEPPPVVAPPPIVSVQTPSPAPVVQVVPVAPPQAPVITPAAPPAPPPPPKPSVAARAQERGNSGTWVTTDDYPSRALREGTEGVTAVAWDVDTEGKVTNCRVTASSGSTELDDAACKNITRRGRYKPAQDADGRPIASSGFSRRVRWQIPKN